VVAAVLPTPPFCWHTAKINGLGISRSSTRCR
jgi:hypothetical protein